MSVAGPAAPRRSNIALGDKHPSRHPLVQAHYRISENDIRAQVTRRKVSGGTRSDMGRDCRDAFLGLAKTCAKLGLSFWDYLGARLGIIGQAAIPYLPDLIRERCQPA